ncbi:hypothetical protein BGX27_004169 [Mortierella sp. AM989]|nr:hypothetical protein BGX27_004169 [Mortierella sp. AM989]
MSTPTSHTKNSMPVSHAAVGTDEPIFSLELSDALPQQTKQRQQQQSRSPQSVLTMQAAQTQTQTQTQAQQIPQPSNRKYPHSDNQYHSDPRQLMPLQIQVTDYSPQSQTTHSQPSEYVFASSWPNGSQSLLNPNSPTNDGKNFQSHRSYQDGMPPTSTSLTSASGHLAIPEKNRSLSGRWSLTGRFFGDRRKSASERESQIPNNPNNCQKSSNGEGLSTSPSNSSSGFSSIIRTRSHSGSGSSNSGKQTTPSSSHRSSLADHTRSLISSLRRASFVDPPPSNNTGNHVAMAAATAAVSASIAAAMGTSPKAANGSNYSSGGEDFDDDAGPDNYYASVDRGWIGENRYVTMAIPKAPPMEPLALSKRPPPKSILKKRSSDTNANSTGNTFTIVAPTPSIAGASSTAPSIFESGNVHPMAAVDENSQDNAPFTLPTERRAKLVTNSPPPNHPQQQLPSPTFDYPDNEPLNPLDETPNDRSKQDSSNLSVSESDDTNGKVQDSYTTQKGVSTPSEYKPGMQSNSSRNRGDDDISQAEMLNNEMMNVGARAQDHARRYYGGSSDDRRCRAVASNDSGEMAPGQRKRSIGFKDRIEIIPAHRKADYNRQSDMNVTFRLLTPDMRSDIRDELNTYKMREMAVHIDSMNNTAFH